MNGSTQRRLGEIVDFLAGNSWKSEDFSLDPIGLPIIRIQNVDAPRYVDFVYWPKEFDPRFLVDKGDVLLTLSGSFRVGVWSGPEALLNQRIVKLIPKAGVDRRWLLHAIRNAVSSIQSMGRHAIINNVALSDLRNLRVSFPSSEEQRRIAAILDKADDLRQKRRAALQKLDSLTQSIFLDMFGDPSSNPMRWKIGTIRDLLESASYGSSEKAGSIGSFTMLRMNNLTVSGRLDLSDLKYIDLPKGQEERWLVKDGDILFNRTNSRELVGKTAVFRSSTAMAYAGYLVRLRVNAESTPEYLSAFLNSQFGKATLRGMCKSIIGMANINATEVQTIQIAIPPKALQREFAQRVIQIEIHREQYLRSAAFFDSQFASLQQLAFQGEL